MPASPQELVARFARGISECKVTVAGKERPDGRLTTREVGQPEDMSSLIARIAHTRPGTSLAQVRVDQIEVPPSH